MAYSGVIADFAAIRAGRLARQVPCVACSEEFDVKWYGKYCYEEFCRDGDKIFEVNKAAIAAFDYDWAWVQIDDCFELEPLGVKCRGEGNILRATYGYLPVGQEVFAKIRSLRPDRDGRMPEKLKALRKLREHFGDTVLVTGSCAAPFSAVGLTWGLEAAMLLTLTDPGLLQEAMRSWRDFYKRYVAAQQQAGAHAIWLGDCNAFSSMLSVAQYQEHVLPVTRDLVRYCEEELEIMIWLHNSEIKLPHVRSHLPLGCSFENIGPAADLREIRAATKDLQAISGNLDPIEVLWRGTPALIEREVERIMGIGKEGGRYIFNTGEMNPRDIPEANMRAMMAAAKRNSRY